eukprot:1140702-Pelagomonas_calceolata.AAC.6
MSTAWSQHTRIPTTLHAGLTHTHRLLSCLRLPLQAPGALDRPEHEDDQLLRAAGIDTAPLAAAAATHTHATISTTTATAATATAAGGGGGGEPSPAPRSNQGSNLAKAQTAPGAAARGAFRRYDGAFDTRCLLGWLGSTGAGTRTAASRCLWPARVLV